MTDMTETKVVYLGKFQVTSGKIGAGLITPETMATMDAADAIVAKASFFTGIRKELIVGCKYKIKALVEDGKIKSIAAAGLSWVNQAGRMDHPSIGEFELRDEGQKDVAKMAAAEKRMAANKAIKPHITHFATMWRAALPSDREYIERGLMRMIRKEANSMSRAEFAQREYAMKRDSK